MEITKQYLSYSDIKDGVRIEHDDYALAAFLTERKKNVFFANPNLSDWSQDFLGLIRGDKVIIGRNMLYETKVKIGNQIDTAQSGSSLDVPEEFRKLGVGGDLFYHITMESPFKYALMSGISDIALPLYRAMKYHILEFPRMMLLCDTYPVIASMGLPLTLTKILSLLANIPLNLWNNYHIRRSKNLKKKFDVRKESIIPDWIDDMVLNDGHKYMEVHDKAWLQWNLDNNFKGDKEDIQSFYSIYKDGKPKGFFMTKERYRAEAGGRLKDFVLGAIVEWGISKDSDTLSETMIYKMALSTFTNKVGIIEFATADNDTCRQMKMWGFIHHGYAHIAFKDRKKTCKDASDIDLWRVRYGYADVILT